MKFGLTAEQYFLINENIVAQARNFGAEVYCFGSRATQRHTRYSDLDLMIEGEISLLQIGAWQEWAQNSSLPIKIDLVRWNDFAESFKETYLAERILY